MHMGGTVMSWEAGPHHMWMTVGMVLIVGTRIDVPAPEMCPALSLDLCSVFRTALGIDLTCVEILTIPSLHLSMSLGRI